MVYYKMFMHGWNLWHCFSSSVNVHASSVISLLSIYYRIGFRLLFYDAKACYTCIFSSTNDTIQATEYVHMDVCADSQHVGAQRVNGNVIWIAGGVADRDPLWIPNSCLILYAFKPQLCLTNWAACHSAAPLTKKKKKIKDTQTDERKIQFETCPL